ncbi:superinfection immunity protein [Ruoffia tabacinasalis]|uniref:superinfection immunity protein n=1 Tax=Ruoffia tabacinasalis TaxID=87458 RepID=UPI003CC81970
MPSIIWKILFFLGVSWDSYISLYLILLAINLIYRLPAVISKGNNKWLIYFVCIIFNWTLIGWFICLIWAFSDNKAFNRENEYRNLLYEQTKRNQ